MGLLLGKARLVPPEVWVRLPMTLRRRWWVETDYGDKPPSEELWALIQTAGAVSVGGSPK